MRISGAGKEFLLNRDFAVNCGIRVKLQLTTVIFMKIFYTWVIILLCLPSTALLAQKLTAVEKKIAAAVDQQIPQTLRLLEDIVNVNSGSLNVTGVRQSGELLRKDLEEMGFTVRWVIMPDSIKTAGHLVASRKGKKGKKILLLAHLDTVFEPDMPSNPYTMLNDSTVTGQGVVDDKGGVIAIIAALKSLHQTNQLNDATITVYLTGDEELGGIPSDVTRADMITEAKRHDVALSFEAGELNKITTSRRGADTWRMYVYGNQAHSSRIFSERAGYGAIYESVRIIESFRQTLSGEKYLTFNPGIFAGGTTIIDSVDNITVYGKDNIIAAQSTIMGDVRFLGEQQRREAREKMRKIVENGNLPGTRAEIHFSNGIPSMSPGEANNALLQEIRKLNLDMGLGEMQPNDPMERGAGDISFIADHIPSLDGLGPSGSGAHAPGEVLHLKQFPVLIQRAAILIYRLSR